MRILIMFIAVISTNILLCQETNQSVTSNGFKHVKKDYLYISNSYRISNLSTIDTNNNQPDQKNNFEKMPFLFGIEAGPAISFNSNRMIKLEIFGYMDINLFKRIIFLKLGFGEIFFQNYTRNASFYFSFGPELKIINLKDHKVYISGGISRFGEEIPYYIDLRYMYSFNKYLGLTAGFKYHVIWPEYSSRFENSIISVGLQLSN